jgi:hypothetical protein
MLAILESNSFPERDVDVLIFAPGRVHRTGYPGASASFGHLPIQNPSLSLSGLPPALRTAISTCLKNERSRE